ncbi:MAG: hypothetical protein AABX62_01380 [Thermoproteota archaeon]
MEAHLHDIIYYGVVNLVHESKIIGTVDVWRCRSCPELFCEDKRFGATDLAPEVGFPRVEPGSKWAALICTRNNTSNWTLTGVRPGATLVHSCTPETKLELKVAADNSLEAGLASGIGQHRIILLEGFVNFAVDVLSGQKHTGTTDAYRALGKPFSFTPPLSAAVVESSKLELFNIAAGSLFLTGLWTLLAAATTFGVYQELALRSLLAIIGVASLVGGYLVLGKSAPGPILGLAVAAGGLVVYTVLLLSVGIVTLDYVLYGLLVVDLFVGWRAWSRLRSIRAARWHPLDMPAYG